MKSSERNYKLDNSNTADVTNRTSFKNHKDKQIKHGVRVNEEKQD